MFSNDDALNTTAMYWDTVGTSVNFLLTDDHVECIHSSAFTVHAYLSALQEDLEDSMLT